MALSALSFFVADFLLPRQPEKRKDVTMKFEKSQKYNQDFLKENMMGPNCIKLLEDLIKDVHIEKGMRVLDLGCGKGLTSIFLAQEFGATVFATDLWIPATENYMRFKEFGLENSIIPIHADALDLPYADDYFDAAVSVDAYHYFGHNADYMDIRFARLIKPGGTIAICNPGLMMDLDGTPEEIKPYVSDEDFATFRSRRWWTALFSQSKRFQTDAVWTLTQPEFDEVWRDWLACDNEYAIRDRDMISANDGKYMSFISVVGKRI